MDKFIDGCKVHATTSDLDLLCSGKDSKEFIRKVIPILPSTVGHFKAMLPLSEKGNYINETHYIGIFLEFRPEIPEHTFFITAKSLD